MVHSLAGQQLGSWKILRELGEGGMGVVHLAEHALIGRKAAIKVLRPEYTTSKDIVGRFFNEARTTAAIKHSGLVDILDFGYAPDGSAYIVMEFLEGVPLGARLENSGAVQLDAVYPIARQIAAAVGAAHAKGIVHRDLKPDNVFLVNDDVAGGMRVKVLDFGIAKLMGESARGMVKTQTGSTMGTPLYMSPEQCRGLGDIDARADIYALGCILFEMATGRLPFDGEGPGDIMASHLKEAPPAPSTFDPALPAGLDALVLKMLAKKPAQRPQTMEEVISALDAIGGRRMTIPALSLAPVPRQPTAPPLGGAPRSGSYTEFESGLDQAVSRSSQLSAAPAPITGAMLGTANTPVAGSTGAPVSSSPSVAALGVAMTQMTQPPVTHGAHSSGQLAARHTTFGGAAGESMARPPKRKRWMLPVAGVLAAAIVVGVIVLAVGGDDGDDKDEKRTATPPVASAPPLPNPSPVPAASPPPALATVRLTIESEPSGAEIFRIADGVRLGKTPHTLSGAPAQGDAVFVLKLDGFKDARVELPADKDGTARADLEAIPVASVAPSPSPVAGKTPRPGKTTKPDKSPKPSTAPKGQFKDGTVDPFATPVKKKKPTK